MAKRKSQAKTDSASVKAVGYVRVSTGGQVEGLSLDAQADEIADYCRNQGWHLVRTYREEGRTAAKQLEKRTEYTRMMRDARSGKFNVVVVYHVDRFSRNPGDYYRGMDQLQRDDVKLVTLDDPDFDITDPGQELSRNVNVAVARHQARESRKKMLNAISRKLAAGKRNIGQRVPFGLTWNEDDTALVHDPQTFPVWQLMMHLREAGWGYGRIADALNGHETVDAATLDRFGVTLPVPNRYGQKTWREGAIASMFRDPARYRGSMEIKFPTPRGERKTFEVTFPPLMTKRQFDRFAALARKKCTWQPRNVGRGSLLSGLCRCGTCGASLNITGSRGFKYYGCANRLRPGKGKKRCTLPLIPKGKLERFVMLRLAEFLLDDEQFKKVLALVQPSSGRVTVEELDRQVRKVDADAKKVQAKLDRLTASVADGLLSVEDIRATRDRIEAERDRLDRRRERIEAQRAGLDRDAERVQQAIDCRDRLLRRGKRREDLMALPMEEQRDLLHALLPPGTESVIIVSGKPPMTPEQYEQEGSGDDYQRYLRGRRKFEVEISGLLPIEQARLKKAVLGGALAVP